MADCLQIFAYPIGKRAQFAGFVLKVWLESFMEVPRIAIVIYS